MKKRIVILDIVFLYDADNVKILNPKLIKGRALMRAALKEFVRQTGYKSCRSINSWIKEWRAHNRLAKLGLFKEHCQDCDLEEKEKWYRLAAYEILGF